jgi:hypothetical protein
VDGIVILGLLVAVIAAWALLIMVLWLRRPRDIALAEVSLRHVDHHRARQTVMGDDRRSGSGLRWSLAAVFGGCSTMVSVALPSDAAPPDVVLVSYLSALARGDCATARALSTPAFANTGPWCFAPHVAAFSQPGFGYQGENEAGYSAQITTEWDNGSVRDGEHTWFYRLRRDPGAPWRVADVGSGP